MSEENNGGFPIPPEYQEEYRWVAKHHAVTLAMVGEPVRYFIKGVEVDYPSAEPKEPYQLGYEAYNRNGECPYPKGSPERWDWELGFYDCDEVFRQVDDADRLRED